MNNLKIGDTVPVQRLYGYPPVKGFIVRVTKTRVVLSVQGYERAFNRKYGILVGSKERRGSELTLLDDTRIAINASFPTE